ncbi:ECF transporter S component [Lactobacillus sp. ESL0731]|uniref:ECF transporter S component n=1 Tax=unclassified Lactobacillus TaxID=2620435 RepID=UPI0023F87D51|nr:MULTISPECIES: ECF transporter S component [unclassified Lactobacillus]WEV51534.1 ECF transporter S component [Lactobacillus sp. ESL0700]WEV62662.1 ECF transporter S component [Lactobacillus sp. ESL0731]
MFTRSSKWNVKAIILVALIGILMGIFYTYGTNGLYNLVKMLLLPTGYAPATDAFFAGLWLMAAPLAMYFVPTTGSGLVGELLASIVEMACGGQWGVTTVVSGLMQGLTNEIGFFPKKSRYQRFSWRSVLTGAFFASFGFFIPCYLMYGWYKFAVKVQIVMFFVSIISSVLFDGVLVKLITNLFDRALKPKIE